MTNRVRCCVGRRAVFIIVRLWFLSRMAGSVVRADASVDAAAWRQERVREIQKIVFEANYAAYWKGMAQARATRT